MFHRPLRSHRTFLVAALLAGLACAASPLRGEEFLGQVVCSMCWTEADRHREPYGGEDERACAARCTEMQIPTALAVLAEDGRFRVHLLAGDPPDGGEWFQWATRFVRAQGSLQGPEGERSLHVTSLAPVEGDPWAEHRANAAHELVEMAWNDLNGRSFSLASLRGRVTVLNFWATWCKPCVEEMPELAAVQRAFGHLGVQVLGAAADGAEKADAVRRFARKHDIPFPLLLGATTDQMESVGLPPALPGTVILDADGRVAERYSGVIERPEVEKALRRLLGSGTDPARGEAAAGGHAPEPSSGRGHAHAPPTEASLVPS